MDIKKAFTVKLVDDGKYQSLLKKDNQSLTYGMHSGRVCLESGSECGVHNTEDKEELLTILKGSGRAVIAGQADLKIEKYMVVYIPPRTEHNIINDGSEALEYVFCVAPVGK